MSYLTQEVEIDHGRIIPSEPNKLPENGRGLLTILPAPGMPTPATQERSPLEALEALQKSLHLDDRQVADWMAAVRQARR